MVLCSVVQVVRFPFGEDKQNLDEYELYEGEMDAKELQGFVFEAIPPFAMAVDAGSVEPFLGAAPGGNDPLKPKVGKRLALATVLCLLEEDVEHEYFTSV